MTRINQYDPFSPEMLENPYSCYAELRTNSPIFWHERMHSWVLTRHRDCREVLRNYEVFARDWRRAGQEPPDASENVMSLDPPVHGPLRSIFLNSLRSQDLEGLKLATRHHLASIFGSLADRAEFDFMSEVAAPVALRLTSRLFGVEEPDFESYSALSEALAHQMDRALNPEAGVAGQRAQQDFKVILDSWLKAEARTGAFADVRSEAARAGADEGHVLNTVGVSFNASYGTIYAAAGNVVLTLLRHPDALDLLYQDQSLLQTAVDELIRFDGPAQGTSRIALKKTTISGTVIEPGQIVLTLVAAANRDPEQFARPDELVLDRSPNHHLGFGWGPHACLGAIVGHLAMGEFVRAMVDAPSRLSLAGAPTRSSTVSVRAVDVLPVTFQFGQHEGVLGHESVN